MNDSRMWDLQLFAEGGGEGSAPAGEGTGTALAAPAAQAVEEPALRPAEERQLRRSGQMKKNRAAAPAQGQAAAQGQGPAAEAQAGKGEAEGKAAGAAGEEGKEAKPAQKSRAEKDAAFVELVKNEYPEQFRQLMQETVERMQAKSAQADARYAPLMKALAEKYGVDANDLDGMVEAVSGPVKDDAYYNALAMQMGTSVENAKARDQLESENRRLKAASQRQAQIAEQQRRAAQVQQIRERWDREATALAAKYPDFDFAAARQNPDFASILRAGGSMEAAYRAVYFDRLASQVQQATAQQVEQGVVDRIAQKAARPAENGISPARAGTVTKKDVSRLTARECEELERRAARGEVITFG